MDLIATTTFGLEAVAKREITDLGFEDITVSDGYVEFSGTAEDVIKANLWLRTADKILIVLNRFKAIKSLRPSEIPPCCTGR